MEPDVDILDQDIETQNTNTDDLDGGLDDNLDNDNFNDNSDDQGKESQEVTPEDEEKALQEQLDAITSMDDDAFFACNFPGQVLKLALARDLIFPETPQEG